MKVFEISGKLYATDQTHQEMLNKLYQLKQQGIHFAGTTKDITDEYKMSEEYIEES